MKTFIGIDPGQNGGWAAIDHDSRFLRGGRWRTSKVGDIVAHLAELKPQVATCYLEKVRLFPSQNLGVVLNTGALLINQGLWQGILIALGIPYQEIDPNVWQSQMGLYKWKAALKIVKKLSPGIASSYNTPLKLAKELWPAAELTKDVEDGLAVALLLAECARQDFISPLKKQIRLAFEDKPKRTRTREGVRYG